MRKRVPVSIRVNPEIDAKTHPYITTGLKKNKFAYYGRTRARLYGDIARSEHLVAVGLSSHIGSQITEIPPFVDAIRSLKGMVSELSSAASASSIWISAAVLGITYKNELPPQPEEYARAIEAEIGDMRLTTDPRARSGSVGNSGIFVSKDTVCERDIRKDLLRSRRSDERSCSSRILRRLPRDPAVKREKAKKIKVDVVGPICESGDFLAKDRRLPSLRAESLIAVMGAGAYGYSMSSNYNSRPRVPEVLVRGDEFSLSGGGRAIVISSEAKVFPDFSRCNEWILFSSSR